MLKKILPVLILALLLAQIGSSAAMAAALAADPVAGCPKGFTLMMVMDEHDPMHTHIGTSADQNGDGWICMMHITDTLHLHVDNTVPLP